VVLSDMAPHTSGQRHRDQFGSYELYARALEIASIVLVQGGSFVGKIFQGPELEDARNQTRAHFESVRIIKPDASRSESFEIFLVGLGAKTTPPPSAAD
jgi:23S rRNA (uridine2552-2'-O)-methyltransferase